MASTTTRPSPTSTTVPWLTSTRTTSPGIGAFTTPPATTLRSCPVRASICFDRSSCTSTSNRSPTAPRAQRRASSCWQATVQESLPSKRCSRGVPGIAAACASRRSPSIVTEPPSTSMTYVRERMLTWYLMNRRTVGRSDRLTVTARSPPGSVRPSDSPTVRRSCGLQNRDNFHVSGLWEQVKRAYFLDHVVDVQPLQIACEGRGIARDIDELRYRIRGEPQRDVPVQAGAGWMDHDRMGHGQTREHIFGTGRDEARRRQPSTSPAHRLLVRVDAHDIGAALDEQRGGIADAAVEVPDRLASHLAELFDGPAASDDAHSRVYLLERGRRKAFRVSCHDPGGAIHGLPPADDLAVDRAGQPGPKILGIEPRLAGRFGDDVPALFPVEPQREPRQRLRQHCQPATQLT